MMMNTRNALLLLLTTPWFTVSTSQITTADGTSLQSHLHQTSKNNGDRRRLRQQETSSSIQRRVLQQQQQQQQDMAFCPQWWFPVYCTLQGLVFSTLCDARNAGYTADDCTVSQEPNAQGCSTNVTEHSNSFLCNGTASYPTICLASMDGYSASQDCVRVFSTVNESSDNNNNTTTTDTNSNTTTSVAVVSPNRAKRCATKPVKPLVCGGTTYQNLCYARIDGYKRVNCTKA